jgi:hypothetical protein
VVVIDRKWWSPSIGFTGRHAPERAPVGKLKRLQRAVGRIYLLLTKEAAVAPNTDYLEDFRAARRLETSIASAPDRGQALSSALAKTPPT